MARIILVDGYAQDLGGAAGLGRAASRVVGRVAVENLGDLPESVAEEKAVERREEVADGLGALGSAAVNAPESCRIRPGQPRPDGALVIGRIAFLRPAFIAAPVRGILRRERAEAVGGQEV